MADMRKLPTCWEKLPKRSHGGIFACRFLRKTLPGAAGEPGEYPASFSVLSTVMAGSEEEITAGKYQFIVEGVTSEIGVRLALGASRPSLVWLILRQGMVPIVMGPVAGVATALIVGRFMQSLLFEVPEYDPMTVAAVVCSLAAVGIAACYVPARCAAGMNPLLALRYE